MSGQAPRTIDDIARLAGVSKSTVSRALNDSPLISRETKDKIRAIAREYNFHINAPARRLSLRESRTVAFITCAHPGGFMLVDQFGLEIMGGIAQGLAELGYDMMVVHVDQRDSDWARSYLDSGRVDGFILLASTRKQRNIDILTAANAPFIAWGIPSPDRSHCSVCGDNVAGVRAVTTHVIKSGRKRIAFLGGPAEEMEIKARFAGYRAGLADAGFPERPELIHHADYCDAVQIARAVDRMLEAEPALDAVVTCADVTAVAAIEALRARGRRVPEDVGVTGYDDLSISAMTNPPLTTVRQCVSTAGRLLAANLVEHLKTGVVTNVTMPAELVVRQSA